MSAHARRVLVVTGGDTDGLPETIHERVARTRAEVLVVAPATNSRLRHWLSDVDVARRDAEERVCRCVEHLRLSSPRDLDRETLRSWCRDRLADYKAPDRVVVLDELPVTSMLKIDKQALVKLASEEHVE